MLKKTITYIDYNGVERTEDFMFNLSKSELMKLELGKTGGYAEALRTIIKSNDGPEIMKVFEDLILTSYGEKSEDGKRFIKSKEISEAFSQTEAYNILFMELLNDSKANDEFVRGILPSDIQSEINKNATREFVESI